MHEKGFREFPGLFAEGMVFGQVFERVFGTPQATATPAPIRRFCLDQIRQAVSDITRTSALSRSHRESARDWISRGYVEWAEGADVCTFDGCCAAIGVDPDAARAVLLAIEAPRRRRPFARPTGERPPVRIHAVVHLLPRHRGRPRRMIVASAT